MQASIFVLQRGWNVIGFPERYGPLGTRTKLTNASVIRRWGTSTGLGQIALNGPTKDTILDTYGEIHFHSLATVMEIKCKFELKDIKLDYKSTGQSIFVLQRAWNIIGKPSRYGDFDEMFKIEDSSVIRQWGTSRGLGQIALGGPTNTTVLEPCGEVHCHELTVIMEIKCLK